MHQPLQNPPVDRQYMRLVIGRQAPPESEGMGGIGAVAAKGKTAQPTGNFVVGLTTFHIRPRARR